MEVQLCARESHTTGTATVSSISGIKRTMDKVQTPSDPGEIRGLSKQTLELQPHATRYTAKTYAYRCTGWEETGKYEHQKKNTKIFVALSPQANYTD
jgi:hypothetical protein